MTTLVYAIDVSMSTEVVFPLPGSDGRLVTFGITYKFVPGKQYYLMLDPGNSRFCYKGNTYAINYTVSNLI